LCSNLGGKWLEIEGFIIDRPYLEQVQARFAGQCQGFSGYSIATRWLSKPDNDWIGGGTLRHVGASMMFPIIRKGPI